jgi:hypothetical protein
VLAALALLHALIHPSAWKVHSPKVPSEVAACYTKIGLLDDAPSTGCLLQWRIIRTVVLPILPGGPLRTQPLIPLRRIVPSALWLVVQGSTELRLDGILRSSLEEAAYSNDRNY